MWIASQIVACRRQMQTDMGAPKRKDQHFTERQPVLLAGTGADTGLRNVRDWSRARTRTSLRSRSHIAWRRSRRALLGQASFVWLTPERARRGSALKVQTSPHRLRSTGQGCVVLSRCAHVCIRRRLGRNTIDQAHPRALSGDKRRQVIQTSSAPNAVWTNHEGQGVKAVFHRTST